MTKYAIIATVLTISILSISVNFLYKRYGETVKVNQYNLEVNGIDVSYDRICLVGDSAPLKKDVLTDHNVDGCEAFEGQAIVLSSNGHCNVISASNVRIMDEYDIECRNGKQKFEIIDRGGIDFLVFKDY